ncbi:hypothetical protein [Timonella senegalensis]|uniref:hypothetical protein n=1 Tax=Timonella senegalensis TaxID=1465825 RepID=UPI0028AD2C70|nr:hypothetical protein [Timonella senegalensis]
MAENENGTVTDPEPEVGTETETQETDLSAEVEKWKAHSRKNEERAKENAEKAKKFDELEEASKTEQQKRDEHIANLEKENAALKSQSLRSQVASEKGVPAELLSGSTQEELEESADALLAYRGETTAKAPKADGQGEQGGTVSKGGLSASEIVQRATRR